MTLEEAKQIALEKFQEEFECDITQFDIEQAASIVYDVLGYENGCCSCNCPIDCLNQAIVYHLINTTKNNPEKNPTELKNDLGSYLRSKGFYPSVRY